MRPQSQVRAAAPSVGEYRLAHHSDHLSFNASCVGNHQLAKRRGLHSRVPHGYSSAWHGGVPGGWNPRPCLQCYLYSKSSFLIMLILFSLLNYNKKTMAKSIIYENLPEIGSPLGFVFYSLLCYLFTLFMSWLISKNEDPEVEVEKERTRQRGLQMRI